MIAVADIARFLDRFLAVECFGEDQGGVWRPSERLVRRIGLALEPWPGIGSWVERQHLDAVFLHRPWRLPSDALAPDVGVLAYHLAFDEKLTTGYNTRLADALGLNNLEPLGEKDGRPLGMIGAVCPMFVSFDDFARTLDDVFGKPSGEARAGAHETLARVAVVGAMNDALVREAARRDAQAYVTGQWRVPADAAVRETGIGVFVVGHRRSEEWGLRALAGVLRERWSALEIVLPSVAR
jgi:putative NIF3 family GTP cyclohydrolase 1 type 2